MLVFIGLGLYDERDVTLRGIEEAKACDVLFAEFYTSSMAGLKINKLEALVGKKISLLEREDIEDNPEKILAHAKRKKAGLMVAGDPMISTTHVQLRIEAARQGIETKIVHNASISSAAPSISGLQNYKFGKSATVALPEKGFFPETPYDVTKENKRAGLHTLLFLDIKGKRMMTANQGIDTLLRIEKRRNEKIFTEETLCVVLGNVGSDDCVLNSGKVRDLIKRDFGTTPHTLIVPGKLHFMEEEYLKIFGGME